MNWLEGDTHTNGISIHYYRTGGEKPSLVLLHGLTDNGLCWTSIAQELASNYDVIMLDARGHGRSSRATSVLTLELLAADVAASIEALKLGQTRLLGHSMGAATAAFVAVKYPEQVQALLLEDPPWPPQRPRTDAPSSAPGLASWLQWIVPLRELPLEERIIQAHKNNPTWLQAELAPWAEAKEQLDLTIFDRGMDLAHPRWTELVGKISCQTLLITGDTERGAIVSQETARQAEQESPQMQTVHIHGAGHNIRREQHTAYMNAISTFFDVSQIKFHLSQE